MEVASRINRIACVTSTYPNSVSLIKENLNKVVEGILKRNPEYKSLPIGILSVLGSEKQILRNVYTDWLIHYFSNNQDTDSIHQWQNRWNSKGDIKLKHVGALGQHGDGVYIWPLPYLIQASALTGTKTGKQGKMMLVWIIYATGETNSKALDDLCAAVCSGIVTFNAYEKESVMNVLKAANSDNAKSDPKLFDASKSAVVSSNGSMNGIRQSWDDLFKDIEKESMQPLMFKGKYVTLKNVSSFLDVITKRINKSVASEPCTPTDNFHKDLNKGAPSGWSKPRPAPQSNRVRDAVAKLFGKSEQEQAPKSTAKFSFQLTSKSKPLKPSGTHKKESLEKPLPSPTIKQGKPAKENAISENRPSSFRMSFKKSGPKPTSTTRAEKLQTIHTKVSLEKPPASPLNKQGSITEERTTPKRGSTKIVIVEKEEGKKPSKLWPPKINDRSILGRKPSVRIPRKPVWPPRAEDKTDNCLSTSVSEQDISETADAVPEPSKPPKEAKIALTKTKAHQEFRPRSPLKKESLPIVNEPTKVSPNFQKPKEIIIITESNKETRPCSPMKNDSMKILREAANPVPKSSPMPKEAVSSSMQSKESEPRSNIKNNSFQHVSGTSNIPPKPKETIIITEHIKENRPRSPMKLERIQASQEPGKPKILSKPKEAPIISERSKDVRPQSHIKNNSYHPATGTANSLPKIPPKTKEFSGVNKPNKEIQPPRPLSFPKKDPKPNVNESAKFLPKFQSAPKPVVVHATEKNPRKVYPSFEEIIYPEFTISTKRLGGKPGNGNSKATIQQRSEMSPKPATATIPITSDVKTLLDSDESSYSEGELTTPPLIPLNTVVSVTPGKLNTNPNVPQRSTTSSDEEQSYSDDSNISEEYSSKPPKVPAWPNDGITVDDAKLEHIKIVDFVFPQPKDEPNNTLKLHDNSHYSKPLDLIPDEINGWIQSQPVMTAVSPENGMKLHKIIMGFSSDLSKMYDNYVCFQGERDQSQMDRFRDSAYQRAKYAWNTSHLGIPVSILEAAKTKLFTIYITDNTKIVGFEKKIIQKVVIGLKMEYRKKLSDYAKTGKAKTSRKDFERFHQKMITHCIGIVGKSMNFNGKLNNVLLEATKRMEESLTEHFQKEIALLFPSSPNGHDDLDGNFTQPISKAKALDDEITERRNDLLEKCERMEGQIKEGNFGKATTRIIQETIAKGRTAISLNMVWGKEANDIEQVFKLYDFKSEEIYV